MKANGATSQDDSGPTTLDAKTQWGVPGKKWTLVLDDTAGSDVAQGEAEVDAIFTGNLATHFSRFTALPVNNWPSGLIDEFEQTYG